MVFHSSGIKRGTDQIVRLWVTTHSPLDRADSKWAKRLAESLDDYNNGLLCGS